MKYESAFLFGANKTPVPEPWTMIDSLETCRIYYIHEGFAYYQLNGHEYQLMPNHMYFFPPNLPFVCRNDHEHPLIHTFFDFIMSPPVILDTFVDFDVAENPALKCLIQAADALILKYPRIGFEHGENAPIIYCLNTILNLIIYEKKLKCVNDPDILKALEMIHSGYGEKISVTDIASALRYNTDYFIRKFKDTMKLTPYAYIKSLKMLEYSRLHELGVKNQEIAARLGYSDSAALCHALKKSISINK